MSIRREAQYFNRRASARQFDVGEVVFRRNELKNTWNAKINSQQNGKGHTILLQRLQLGHIT